MFPERRHLLDQAGGVQLCVLGKDYLVAAADLALETFYKPRLQLNTDGMGKAEESIANSVIETFGKWEKCDAWLSNYIGYRNRVGGRLNNPSLGISSDALIIGALANSVLVGLVELSLEVPDGKLPPPLRLLPRSMDKISRCVAVLAPSLLQFSSPQAESFFLQSFVTIPKLFFLVPLPSHLSSFSHLSLPTALPSPLSSHRSSFSHLLTLSFLVRRTNPTCPICPSSPPSGGWG
jgi:hypothetical protein